MGVLSDELNPMREFTIAGATFEAKQICLTDLFLCVIEALKELGVEHTGIEMEDQAAAVIRTGVYPRASFKGILEKCAPSLDEDDIKALLRSKIWAEIISAINWMVDGTEPKETPDPKPVTEGEAGDGPEKKTD